MTIRDKKMFSRLDFRIIAILIILIGVGIWCRQECDKSDYDLKQTQALQIFLRIDDLAHMQFADMETRWNPSGFTWYEEFEKIDSGFHNAKSLDERFKRAKDMDKFFDGMDEYLHKVGGLTTTEDQARDQKYHEINDIFDQLK